MPETRVTFPHFANYYVPLEHLMTHGLDVDYVIPPPLTKKTLELGGKYSPDYVCAPFKLMLGSFIEAIEKGANTLVMVGGACRLGYYGELHQQILQDLGYEASFVNMARASFAKPQTFYNEFKKINPTLNLAKASAALVTALNMAKSMDTIDDFVRKNIGFELQKGSFQHVYDSYLESLRSVESGKELKYLTKNYLRQLKTLPVDKPVKPLRVGVVGEYYSIMDPFSNHYIEEEMARKGVEVERWMNVTNSLFHYEERDMLKQIKGYAKYNMGATSMSTIERTLKFAKRGFDGIIHLKSFGCTPEMDAMPVLQNISQDYNIPILYFSFDSQTEDTGIQTRLEAFYDMIIMRKEAAS